MNRVIIFENLWHTLIMKNFNELLQKFPVPFNVYDEQQIRENVTNVKNVLKNIPDVKIFFNAKSNPNPYILKIFEEEDCGALCSSMADLLIAIKSSMKEEKIFLDASSADDRELSVASMRSARMLCSGEDELERIKTTCFQIPDGICFNTETFSREKIIELCRQCLDEGVLHVGIKISSANEAAKYYEEYIASNNLSGVELCITADDIFMNNACVFVNEKGIVEQNAGVNGRVLENNYNGHLRSAEFLIAGDDSIKQIRRAETYDDLFATIDFSELPYCD